jgi:hypothetical protein
MLGVGEGTHVDVLSQQVVRDLVLLVDVEIRGGAGSGDTEEETEDST